MPFNLLKRYDDLLDIVAMTIPKKLESLKGVFNRDIVNNANFNFRGKNILPTPAEGQVAIETLFRHLTTEKVDKKTNAREFEIVRSERIHWIKYHIEESKEENMLIFSVDEPEGNRTYIYDSDKKYVIVLEPLRSGTDYYLLSAYKVRGKDGKRNKIEKKFARKLPELL